MSMTIMAQDERRANINAAARVLFRSGETALNREQRDLLTSSGSAGGLVQQAFDSAFVEASKYFGPIWNMVHRKDSENGEPTKFVTTDPTGQTFSLAGEGSTSASGKAQQATMFSDVTDTDTLVSSVIYSVQELADAFDLESFLTRTAGLAVSRAREVAVTLGTTNDGASTALPNSPSGGMLGGVTAGVTTAALADGIDYLDMVNLKNSVDRSYQINGVFMVSSATNKYLEGLLDGFGRPYYHHDPDTGLLIVAGKLVYVNTAMPDYSSASVPAVLFGDYSRFYSVLNAGGVKIKVVSNDASPALSMLTRMMIIYTRIGATTGVSSAVKALVTAAS